MLKPKDINFFNPDTPNEHDLGPIAIVGSETIYHNIYI